jgi:hypothetical protein
MGGQQPGKGDSMKKNLNLTEPPKTSSVKDPAETPGPLPGWPGYRTRGGRSGLDPIDNNTEAGHTVGTFLQGLISGQLIIRNPLSLFFWGLVVLLILIPSCLAIFDMVIRNAILWETGIYLFVAAMVGLMGLNIFIRNLIRLLSR